MLCVGDIGAFNLQAVSQATHELKDEMRRGCTSELAPLFPQHPKRERA
jgi:hypothetical protein